MSSILAGLIMIASGIFAILGTSMNRMIVMGSGKLLNMLLGDTMAHVIYFLTGVILFVLGVGEFIAASWKPI